MARPGSAINLGHSTASGTGHWPILQGVTMKQVLAVVKPHLAEAVIEALLKAPVEALTVREVRGYGRQKDYLNQYGETEYALAFLPKVEIEVWVDDTRLQEVLEVIEQTANTGRLGDGKVMVLPVKTFRPITDETLPR